MYLKITDHLHPSPNLPQTSTFRSPEPPPVESTSPPPTTCFHICDMTSPGLDYWLQWPLQSTIYGRKVDVQMDNYISSATQQEKLDTNFKYCVVFNVMFTQNKSMFKPFNFTLNCNFQIHHFQNVYSKTNSRISSTWLFVQSTGFLYCVLLLLLMVARPPATTAITWKGCVILT